MTTKNEEIKPLDAPVVVEIKVHIVSEKETGVATIAFNWGHMPTKEEIKESLKKFEREKLPAIANGKFRLMTTEEFVNALLKEKHGITEQFALPAALRKFTEV